ncbi:MAG: ATP-binding cassette domain-containing protein [Eubacteriales bacterium]
MAEPILEIKGITKRFGGVTAVDNVSFSVNKGEVFGLLGDNGAGKSTMIKMVCGVYKADEGEIIFDGQKIENHNPRKAREIGIETVFQDLALVDPLDIPANIFLGRELRTGPFGFLNKKKMAQESLSLLQRLKINIPELSTSVLNLSGGQRQAIAIARNVYWNAKMVIMDEPTAALGVRERNNVLDIIRTLREQGVTVLLISHNMEDVFAVTDHIAIMRRGQKRADLMTKETTTAEVVSVITGAIA